MDGVFDILLSASFWGAALRIATPLMFGVLGALICERAGVPTIAEVGMPGFAAVSWYALMAPAGTPDAIIAKLREGTISAINAPEAKAALEAQGAQPVGNTPAELAAVIAADTARWAKVIRDADIKLAP